jgi:hypothetical protein
MPHEADGVGFYIVPLAAVLMILLRHSRTRRLRVERLWLAPVIFIVIAGLILAAQAPPAAAVIAIEAAALALGALAGWWRGRLTQISIDPATHQATTRTSALGMAFILGLFALRFALRSFSGATAGWLHLSVLHLTDILLVFAVGLVCAQRLELALRATRLLNVARAS